MDRLPPGDLQTYSSSIVDLSIYIPSVHALVSHRIYKSSLVGKEWMDVCLVRHY